MDSYIKNNRELLSEDDEDILLHAELIKQEIAKIHQIQKKEYDEKKKKEIGNMINPYFDKLTKMKQDMVEVKQKITNIQNKCPHKIVKENWYSSENCLYCKKQFTESDKNKAENEAEIEAENKNQNVRMLY